MVAEHDNTGSRLARRKFLGSAFAVTGSIAASGVLPTWAGGAEVEAAVPNTSSCLAPSQQTLPVFLRGKFPKTKRLKPGIGIKSLGGMSTDGVAFIWDRDHITNAEVPDPAPFVANDSYFRLHLVSMNLKKNSTPWAWFVNNTPSVMSTVTVGYVENNQLSQKDLPYVDSTKDITGVDDLGKFKKQNLTLTPLVPYRGNKIHIFGGLVSVAGTRDVSPFLTALGGVAKLIMGFPLLSQAVTFATAFMGALAPIIPKQGTKTAVCGVDTDLDAQDQTAPLQATYIACYEPGTRVNNNATPLDTTTLFVNGSGLMWGSDLQHLHPLSDANWILLRIEHLKKTRNDYPNLFPTGEMTTALDNGLTDSAKQKRLDLRSKVRSSSDVTDTDKGNILSNIDKDYTSHGGKL